MSKNAMSCFLTVCLAVMLVTGCSSDSSTSPEDDTGTGLPDFSDMAITVPAAMQTAASSNSGVATAVSLISMANSISSYSAWMIPGGTSKLVAVNDGPYTWTIGDLTVVLTVMTVDSYTTWTVTLNGTNGENQYEDFVLMSGTLSPNGMIGSMSVYVPGETIQLLSYWSWVTTLDGTYSIDLYSPMTSTTVSVERNPDGSGTVTQEVESTTRYAASWNPDGTGTYTYYDADGNVTGSGSW